MLAKQLESFEIILASGSPRRQHFFKEMDIPYTLDVRKVEEVYPPHLKEAAITDYLAQLKAKAFTEIKAGQIIITSDTTVWKDGRAIEKPFDKEEAISMLQELSGERHTVYTSVCFTGSDFQKTVHDATHVWFKKLSLEEITYYVDTHQPYDKAGSYGIQDWLGYIGVEKIEGCFFNVMGLPTRLVYKTLMEIANR